GNANRFHFPEPKVAGYDFSFSGLKTSILYFLRDKKKKNENFIAENLNDICASIQDRIVSILLNKLEKAATDLNISELSIAGGVSANSHLRKKFEELCAKRKWNCYIPKFEYCTDNAAMIAMVGHYKFLEKDFSEQSVVPKARLPIATHF
ncbi:MAG: tRNA (adenosine(37)-N6)-threonylcarbamoyltransferase complex transferase subunit TsaD, partial [Bacteroidota bacterium]